MSNRRVTNMEDWRGMFAGERCFVVGNGPSLLYLDMDKLIPEYTFATNRIGALWNHSMTIDWRPSFFVLTSNQTVARKSWQSDVIDTIRQADVSFVNTVNRRVIPEELHHDIWWMPDCRHEAIHDGHVPDDYWSHNPAVWISKFGTSWLPMMQLAVWMGFDPIYQIGCDLDFKAYDPSGEDPNHFYKDYDGAGYKFTKSSEVSVMRRVPAAHNLAHRVTEKLGVEVYQSTPGGMDIWPKKPFEEVLNEANNETNADGA